jgi:hypothetical protein
MATVRVCDRCQSRVDGAVQSWILSLNRREDEGRITQELLEEGNLLLLDLCDTCATLVRGAVKPRVWGDPS